MRSDTLAGSAARRRQESKGWRNLNSCRSRVIPQFFGIGAATPPLAPPSLPPSGLTALYAAQPLAARGAAFDAGLDATLAAALILPCRFLPAARWVKGALCA